MVVAFFEAICINLYYLIFLLIKTLKKYFKQFSNYINGE